MPPGTTRLLVRIVFILPTPIECYRAGRHSLERLVRYVLLRNSARSQAGSRRISRMAYTEAVSPSIS